MDTTPTLLVYLIVSALTHTSAQTTFQFDKTIFVNKRLSIKPPSQSTPIAPPFPYHIQSILPSKRTGTVIALGDLNGDGTLDILTDHTVNNERHIEAWINNGIGGPDGVQFSPAVDLPIIGPAVFAVGDMNGDGLADLIVGRKYKTNQVHINQRNHHPNDGRATKKNKKNKKNKDNDDGGDDNYSVVNLPEIAGTLPSETKSITVADVDGDGDLDIIERDSQRNRILINDGTGEHYTILHLPNPVGGNTFVTAYASNIAVADMDGDGDQEVLFCNMGEESNTLMHNVGDGKYDMVDLPGEKVSRNLVVGDVNGDGHLDIVTGLQPVLLLNKGNGVDYDVIELPGLDLLRPPGISKLNNDAKIEDVNEVALEDLNGDGLLDIIYCTMEGPVVLIHRGDGSADVYTIPSFGEYGFISMAFGDINNDGVVDMAMAHSKFNHSHILLLSGQDANDVDKGDTLVSGQNAIVVDKKDKVVVPIDIDEEDKLVSPIDTDSPTKSPTSSRTTSPTKTPASPPTDSPTNSPKSSPTDSPTRSPTKLPTDSPLVSGHVIIDVGYGDKLASSHDVVDGKGDTWASKLRNKSTLSDEAIEVYLILFLVALLLLLLLCMCCKRCRGQKVDAMDIGGSTLLQTAKAKIINTYELSEAEESEMVRLQIPMRVI